MDCETFRRRIGEDPARLTEECARHAEQCPACSAYAARARHAEALVHRALRFDVKTARARGGKSRGRAPLRTAGIAAAAAIVGALAMWVGMSRGPSYEDAALVTEVLDHWHLEPDSWVKTSTPVPSSLVEEVTSGRAQVRVSRLGLVSYANLCYVHGQWVPHLVVQGTEGPIMVLLLPRQHLDRDLPLALPAEGLKGVLVPFGKGSIALLGEDGEPIEALRERMPGAVRWTT
jgi:hypothetical protein